jgi:hypothetical protein
MLNALQILLLEFDFHLCHRLFISIPYLYKLWTHLASCLVGTGGNSLCDEVGRTWNSSDHSAKVKNPRSCTSLLLYIVTENLDNFSRCMLQCFWKIIALSVIRDFQLAVNVLKFCSNMPYSCLLYVQYNGCRKCLYFSWQLSHFVIVVP